MTIYDFLLIVIVIILCFTVMHIWKLLTEIVKWIGDNMNIKDTQIKLLQQKLLLVLLTAVSLQVAH